MFEGINTESNLLETIANHYRDVLGVEDFKDPKDMERLRKQIQYDVIELQLCNETERYDALINK